MCQMRGLFRSIGRENLKTLLAFAVLTGNIFLPFSSLVYTTGRGHPACLCMMSSTVVDIQSHSLGGYYLPLVSSPSSHPPPSPLPSPKICVFLTFLQSVSPQLTGHIGPSFPGSALCYQNGTVSAV